MKRKRTNQVQTLADNQAQTLDAETTFVRIAVFEREGKTILQPLTTQEEAKNLSILFQNKTLEVWLSNGESDFSLFDVNILKYSQQSQPLTKCTHIANQACLKNLVESIVCCAQCPLGGKKGDE